MWIIRTPNTQRESNAGLGRYGRMAAHKNEAQAFVGNKPGIINHDVLYGWLRGRRFGL
jgi:hypothetical protein